MASCDRTAIVGLLKPIWPELADMLSSEVQAFVNQKTGCNVTDTTPNGIAFDMWRQAVAKDHPEVWPYTQARIDAIQRKSREMKADEERRQKAVEERLGREGTDGQPV